MPTYTLTAWDHALVYLLPHTTALERHLAACYGKLFAVEFDVLPYHFTTSCVEDVREFAEGAMLDTPDRKGERKCIGLGGWRKKGGNAGDVVGLVAPLLKGDHVGAGAVSAPLKESMSEVLRRVER